jgi:3-deoxy-D-manno-octulosonate 8-phosphate phosphatase (KDO 8-P phosphatase)
VRPARIRGQPCSCGSVGVPNLRANHSLTRGWAHAREEGKESKNLFYHGSFVKRSPSNPANRRIVSFSRAGAAKDVEFKVLESRAMTKSQSAKTRAKKIKLLLFDVDGVLTDGKLFIFPAPAGAQQSILEHSAKHGGTGGFGLHSQSLIEAKGFHAHDGTAISLARLAGITTGLITKRVSETVALRARDLRLEHVHQGIQDKLTVFRQILKDAGLTSTEAAFVGDDVIDLPVMRNCGFAVAVANARDEVKADAHYVTRHSGGDGALRDAVEYILKAQGKWKQVVESYIGERSPRNDSQ